ncbi:hypothetical protein MJ588_15435 [Klebsiella pneumoniae]|nr:hypothetical protein MJ588_15435 [Klebsiella pneumoniae]
MTVLSVEDLRISYRSRGEWRELVHIISFSIQRGDEMLAFVGESGSRENHHRAGRYRPAGGLMPAGMPGGLSSMAK